MIKLLDILQEITVGFTPTPKQVKKYYWSLDPEGTFNNKKILAANTFVCDLDKEGYYDFDHFTPQELRIIWNKITQIKNDKTL